MQDAAATQTTESFYSRLRTMIFVPVFFFGLISLGISSWIGDGIFQIAWIILLMILVVVVFGLRIFFQAKIQVLLADARHIRRDAALLQPMADSLNSLSSFLRLIDACLTHFILSPGRPQMRLRLSTECGAFLRDFRNLEPGCRAIWEFYQARTMVRLLWGAVHEVI